MKYLQVSFFVMMVAAFISCSKKSGGGEVTPTPPTDLTVSSTISADNNGNVTFTASAKNAMTYDFDFGNGVYQTVPSGVVTYKYPASGNYTVNVIAKSKTGQTISKSIQITVAVTSSLIWSDEFDTPGAPNPAKWGYDLGNNNGWGNSELEYYTNRTDNVIVSNGTLKITAKKESFSGFNYTSTRLQSNNKFSFKYGKVEVKAKLPSVGGSWPAIWMLGSNFTTNPWPACGEIDIMEHVGNQLNKIHGTLHYPEHFGGNADTKSTMINTATTEFHRYGLEWTPTVIKISVDDVVFFTYANTSGSPFNANFFMILNVAVGGTFGGAVDPSFNSATMEIDYVRVYQ